MPNRIAFPFLVVKDNFEIFPFPPILAFDHNLAKGLWYHIWWDLNVCKLDSTYRYYNDETEKHPFFEKLVKFTMTVFALIFSPTCLIFYLFKQILL